MIIDGRAIASDIIDDVRARAARLPDVPSFLAIAVAPSPATQSYLRMKQSFAEKAGIRMEVRIYDEQTTEGLIDILSRAEEDAIIVQLPLPESIDTQQVLDAIPSGKDADVLSAATRAEGRLVHPVAGAVAEVLKAGNIDPSGKRAVVIGQGWLVGAPVAEELRASGALVTVVTKDSGDLLRSCTDADIIVSGAGSAGLIKPEHVRPGAAIIDIGTSELGGTLAGDVAPEVADIAGLFTPVPGGVGPMTVARLLSNVLILAERRFAK